MNKLEINKLEISKDLVEEFFKTKKHQEYLEKNKNKFFLNLKNGFKFASISRYDSGRYGFNHECDIIVINNSNEVKIISMGDNLWFNGNLIMENFYKPSEIRDIKIKIILNK